MNKADIRSLLDLSGRVAVVTGGGGGIGRVIAGRFGAAGARVVVHCRSSRDKAEAAARGIREAGGEAAAVGAELAGDDGAERLAEEAVRSFGRIDVLVNNAGIFPQADLLEQSHGDRRGPGAGRAARGEPAGARHGGPAARAALRRGARRGADAVGEGRVSHLR